MYAIEKPHLIRHISMVAGWLSAVVFMLLASPALAQVSSEVPGLALGGEDPRIIAARIIRAVLGFLGILVVLLILYGGFTWMTAAGDEEKIAKAKRILTNAIIGLVIILSAFSIAQFVLRSLERATRGPETTGGAGGSGAYGAAGASSYFLVRSISPRGEVPIRNVVVRVEFNRAVDPASVTPESFQIKHIEGPSGAILGLVDGTRTVRGSTVEFRPVASCPAPNQAQHCFDENTWFRVSAELAIRSTDGRNLTCNLPRLPGFPQVACTGEFRTGTIVDVTPPEVTIESPDNGESVRVDSCVPVQARVRDDAGIASVEFFADGVLIEPDGTAVTPQTEPSPTEALLSIPCWDTTGLATPSSHRLKAKAYDINDHSAESRPIDVLVRPAHCFNNIQDAGETGIDCGGDCGACDGSACTTSSQCAGGACVSGVCASPLTITGVSPGDGRAGTLLTIAGRSFGTAPGTVTFNPGVAASAPDGCGPGTRTWSDEYVLVGVPAGASTGPITVASASCAGARLCTDTTNDERGPIVPVHPPPDGSSTPSGSFEINDISHPALCSAISPPAPPAYPASGPQGYWSASVALSGFQMGQSQGSVSFSGVPAPAAGWSPSGATSAVPPVSYGSSQVQLFSSASVPSNSLPYNVLPPDAGTTPEITSITPDEGGVGQGMTIEGRHFGESPGIVWFIAPDGQSMQADTSVPSQCGGSFWSDTSVVIKVPRVEDRNDVDRDGNRGEILTGTYQVYVHRYDSADSNRRNVTVTNAPAGPFLACILPISGPLFTNVSVFGERLGAERSGNGGLFFTSRDSSTPDSEASNWGSIEAALTSVGGAPGDPCPAGGWSQTEVCAQVPLNASSGDLILENAVSGVTLRSNPLSFAVGECGEAVPASERLDCGALTCCPNGSCALSCAPGEQGVSAYGWSFTTAPARLIPEVVFFCDTSSGVGHPTAPPSPAPWDRADGNKVCVNAALSVRFTTRIDDATLRPNLKVETCQAPENFIDDPGFETGSAPWDPGVVEPTHLAASRVLSLDRSGSGNYGLQLTKLDDDVGQGPGGPDPQGRYSDFEHWFGYQANVIPDTNGKTYTASVWLKAGDPQALGKRAGILIERNGGNFEKSSQDIKLTTSWQQVTVSHTFSEASGPTLPGFVRIFLDGLPYQPSVPNDPLEIFSVDADDVEVTADPCTQSSILDTSGWSAPEIYEQDLASEGFTWSPPSPGALTQNTWYRVVLLGGDGGIRGQGDQGATMEVMQDAQGRCGDSQAAYCYRFKTRASSELCEVGGIAVSPNPWIARSQFEEIPYRANPVSAQDPCIALNPASYDWSWTSSDLSRASLTSPVHTGHTCASSADCVVGSCTDGFCGEMGWTTTAVALAETEPENPVEVGAHVGEVSGEGELRISFVDPLIESYWPACGSSCTNALVGGRFNTAMDASTVTNDYVQLWSVACGNGQVEHAEDCDDGNVQDGDGCSSICLHEGADFTHRCGNGATDPAEDCDDGNLASGDGCSNNCINEGTSAPACGNGATDPAEDCDDGNTTGGDGCSATCLHEGTRADVPICGNRRVDRGEECEANFDGAFADWCDTQTCLRQGTAAPLCGNGRIDPGEECDRTFAGNWPPNNLCNENACLWVGTLAPTNLGGAGCGNGTVEIGEDCDDGNRTPGDGCSETCLNEGAVTTSPPACGNSVRDAGEDCDDGNVQAGDGCSVQCLNEGTPSAICGNGVLEQGEDCDRGILAQTYPPDIVSAICSEDCRNLGADPLDPPAGDDTARPNSCGNSVRNDGEDCDDGNNASNDGCSSDCQNEGRVPQRVTDIAVSYSPDDLTFDLGVLQLAPLTFYRVMVAGDDRETFAHEGVLSALGKPLRGLNFFYDWSAPNPPAEALPGGVSPNTFSWTFKTGQASCGVDRVELSPADASLYVVGARQRYSSIPFGPPDPCNPQGQRLNPVQYSWSWNTQAPGVVADIVGRTTIDGDEHNGIDVIPSCGNGRLERAEDCDDGNTTGGDGCSSACLNEGSNFTLACGNLTVGPGEECDDGNLASGDGCSNICLNEGSVSPICGNGALDFSEDCDDGNIIAGDGCSPVCLNEGTTAASSLCGNGAINSGEECDPEEPGATSTYTVGTLTINGPPRREFCDPLTCLLRGSLPQAHCGNFVRERGEDCDDGNKLSQDGCSALCLNEGSLAAGVVCGNGVTDKRGEDCDDGNIINGDGCSSLCLNEGTVSDDPARIDPYQQAVAQGLRDTERARGWSTVEVEAGAQGKSGNSPLTVYCVAQDDTDCPIPRGQPGYNGSGSDAVGRGAGNCCYERPSVLARNPQGQGNCRNAMLRAVFTQTIDEASLPHNFRIAKIVDERTGCPAEATTLDSQGNPVTPSGAYAPQPPRTWLGNLRSWLGALLRRLTRGAQAQGEVACIFNDLTLSALPTLTSRADEGIGNSHAPNADDQISAVTLRPSRLLDANTRYRIYIYGDRNINDPNAEGVRSSQGVGLNNFDSWDFETGPDVCTLDEVRITTDGSTALNTRGETRTVHAHAWSYGGGGTEIQPTAGYRWRWTWADEKPDVAAVSNNVAEPAPPEGGELATQTVTAGEKNGVSTITATATIFENAITGEQSSVHGTERFTVLLCENPWPQVDGDPVPYSDPSDPSTNMNFETMYCRDKGIARACDGPGTLRGRQCTTDQACKDGSEQGQCIQWIEDDLPALEYPGAVLAGAGLGEAPGTYTIASTATKSAVPQVLREFLLPVIHDKQPRDAIGIRVMSNPARLSPLSWYRAQLFRGSPEVLSSPPDGFSAIRDGRSVYIAAPNAIPRDPSEGLGYRVFSNIYIISYNEDADPDTRAIFDQMVQNIVFNTNLANSKVCEDGETACSADLDCNPSGAVVCLADKDKLRRDLGRMNDFTAIADALEGYREHSSGRRYPTLEAGTYVRSISTSRWPSWQATFGAALGVPIPEDPLNRFAQGCSGTFDPLTCWSETTQTYRCPPGSHVYQYRSLGGVEASLSADFERIGKDGWEVPRWPPRPRSDAPLTLEITGLCAGEGETWSNARQLCGNHIIEPPEACEPGDVNEQTFYFASGTLHCSGAPSRGCVTANTPCTDPDGVSQGICLPLSSCIARRGCSTGCDLNLWALGDPYTATAEDCTNQAAFCGNGRVDPPEICDDGLPNGSYGKCRTDCTGRGVYCGDGTRNGPETCDDGTLNGEYGHCRFDCSGQGERCSDNVVQAPDEQCDGGTQTLVGRCVEGDQSRINTPCTTDTQCDSIGGSGDGDCAYCGFTAAGSGPIQVQTPQTTTQGYTYAWRRNCTDSCSWETDWQCVAQGQCGNGAKEGAEQCDDGNTNNTDGCTNSCTTARCGDGVEQGKVCSGNAGSSGKACATNQDCGAGGVCSDHEECDLGAQNGSPCDPRYGGTCTYCDTSCNFATLSGGSCGDGLLQAPDEQCDGVSVAGWVCAGVVGQNEWFWHFAKADEVNTWVSITPLTSVLREPAWGGYLSATAMRIRVDDPSIPAGQRGAKTNAIIPGGGRSYRASVWVNTLDPNGFGKTAGIGFLQTGSTFPQVNTIILDSDPASWQRLTVSRTLSSATTSSYSVMLYLPDAAIYPTYFDDVHVEQVQSATNLALPAASCSADNCTTLCPFGGVPCNTVTLPPAPNYDAPGASYTAPFFGAAPSSGKHTPVLLSQSLTYLPTTTQTTDDYQIVGDTFVDPCDNDKDNDGYPAGAPGDTSADCDDKDPAKHPNAVEDCDDGVDNNCDGVADNGCRELELTLLDPAVGPGTGENVHCLYLDGTLLGYSVGSAKTFSMSYMVGQGAHEAKILYHHNTFLPNPVVSSDPSGSYQFSVSVGGDAVAIRDVSLHTSSGSDLPSAETVSGETTRDGFLRSPAQSQDAVESGPASVVCDDQKHATDIAGMDDAGSATYIIKVVGCISDADCTGGGQCVNGICTGGIE